MLKLSEGEEEQNSRSNSNPVQSPVAETGQQVDAPSSAEVSKHPLTSTNIEAATGTQIGRADPPAVVKQQALGRRIRNKADDLAEKFREYLLVRSMRPWILLTSRFLAILSPLLTIAGVAILQSIVVSYLQGKIHQDWASFLSNKTVVATSIAVWLCIAVVTNIFNYLRGKTQLRLQANEKIENFYVNMAFDTQKKYDIRVTLWCPIRWDLDSMPSELEQWTDYYPSERKKIAAGSVSYVENARAGRRRKVYKSGHDNSGKTEKQPIGLLGYCAYSSVKEKNAETMFDKLPPGVSLYDYMVNTWNFEHHHAKRITPDRRSFMCIPLMDRTNTTLLAVILCDSDCSDETVFNANTAQKAEKYLPDIAKAISRPKNTG